ncbi:Cd(II)/Pb(II)-sensing metalloregulatory transcriptional regulator CmtR [Clavibacter zhangzhiyongii]|uniref:Cd(II)/Pb(II)-sensing metalloregulatory transcriptional regulator CmtR n=1 Tax=Clavibacter zhangzhiyongii TaxID=2768071 RepID=UPI0039E1FD05
MTMLAPRLDVMTRLGRALADPTRSRILVELLDGPAYPALLAEALGLTRQNVSNHLTCLRGCGIVRTVPEGRSVRYEIADPRIARALGALVEVVLAVEDDRASADPALCAPGCCEPGA